MACNSKLKNAHYKSAQNAYNNTAQTFVAAGTPVNVLGSDRQHGTVSMPHR